jgi:hypothetical protein
MAYNSVLRDIPMPFLKVHGGVYGTQVHIHSWYTIKNSFFGKSVAYFIFGSFHINTWTRNSLSMQGGLCRKRLSLPKMFNTKMSSKSMY